MQEDHGIAHKNEMTTMLNVKESLIIIKICKLPLKLLPRNGFATKDFIQVGIGFFSASKGSEETYK